MTTLAIGFVLIVLLVALVLLGMQIAYALFGVAFIGIWIIRDNIDLGFRMLELTVYSGIADYLFATIPLFVLMGLLVSVSNVGRDTFEVAEELLRRMLCGLGVATVAAMAVSVVLLALAAKTLPIGTAYAVWTGIGAIGAVILGIVLFGDPATPLRLACVGLILLGVVGLKLVGGAS